MVVTYLIYLLNQIKFPPVQIKLNRFKKDIFEKATRLKFLIETIDKIYSILRYYYQIGGFREMFDVCTQKCFQKVKQKPIIYFVYLLIP